MAYTRLPRAVERLTGWGGADFCAVGTAVLKPLSLSGLDMLGVALALEIVYKGGCGVRNVQEPLKFHRFPPI